MRYDDDNLPPGWLPGDDVPEMSDSDSIDDPYVEEYDLGLCSWWSCRSRADAFSHLYGASFCWVHLQLVEAEGTLDV